MRPLVICCLLLVSLLAVQVPGVQTQSASTATSNCPSSAMPYAVALSAKINGLNLPSLNGSSTSNQIASAINGIIPEINSEFSLDIPSVSPESTHGLVLLVGPYDDFVISSQEVNQDNPSSACNFLVDTFTLAADITLLATGNVSALATYNTISQYCGSSCLTQLASNIGNFISQNLPNLESSWNSALGKFLGESPGIPEFPEQALAVVALVVSLVVLYVVVRNRTPTHLVG